MVTEMTEAPQKSLYYLLSARQSLYQEYPHCRSILCGSHGFTIIATSLIGFSQWIEHTQCQESFFSIKIYFILFNSDSIIALVPFLNAKTNIHVILLWNSLQKSKYILPSLYSE